MLDYFSEDYAISKYQSRYKDDRFDMKNVLSFVLSRVIKYNPQTEDEYFHIIVRV